MKKYGVKKLACIALSITMMFTSVNAIAAAQDGNSKVMGVEYSRSKEWTVRYNPELPVDELLGSHEKSDGTYLIFGKKNGKFIVMDGQYNYIKTLDVDSIDYARGGTFTNSMGKMTWLQGYKREKGFFVAKKDDKVVLIDENLNETYTEYNAVNATGLKENDNYLQDNIIYKEHYLYKVAKAVDGVWYYGLVDDEGNEVMQPRFTYINNINTEQWGDEQILCKIGSLTVDGVKYGFSNLEGNIIIKPQYDDVTAICSLYSNENDFRYMYMSYDSDGNEQFGVRDSNGKVILKDEWDSIRLDNSILQELSIMAYNYTKWPDIKINGEWVTQYRPKYSFKIGTIDSREILLADKQENAETQVYVDGEPWFSSGDILPASTNEKVFSDEVYDTDCICKLKSNTSAYELLFYNKEGKLTQTKELSTGEVTSLQEKRREKIIQKVYEKACDVWIDKEKEKLVQKFNDRCTKYGYKFNEWVNAPETVVEKKLTSDYSMINSYTISFKANVEKNGETEQITYKYIYDINGHCVEGGFPVYGKHPQPVVPGEKYFVGYYNEDTKELLVKDSSYVDIKKGSIYLNDDPTKNVGKWSELITGTASGLLEYSGETHDLTRNLTFDDNCNSFVKDGEKTLYYHKENQVAKDRYKYNQSQYVYDSINIAWEIIKRSTIVSPSYNSDGIYVFDDQMKKLYIISGKCVTSCDYTDVGLNDKYDSRKLSLYSKGNVSVSWIVDEKKEWKVYYKNKTCKTFSDENYQIKNVMETGRYIMITFSCDSASDSYYVIDKVENTGEWLEKLPEKYQNVSENYSFSIDDNEYWWMASNDNKYWVENRDGEAILENLPPYFMVMKEYFVVDVGKDYRLFDVYDSELNLVAEDVRPNDTQRLEGDIRRAYYTVDGVTMYVLWDIPKMELIGVVKGYPLSKVPYIVGNSIVMLDDNWNGLETESPSTSSPLQSDTPASSIPTGGAITPSVSPTASALPVQSPKVTAQPSQKPIASPDPSELPINSPKVTVCPTEVPISSPKATVNPSQNPVTTGDGKSGNPGKGAILYDQATGNRYQVISAGKSVSFVSVGEKESAISVTVPARVTLGGQSYKVTSIADKAFCDCKKIKSIVIGKNITKIGTKAFYKCKQLKRITIKTTLLRDANVGTKAFYGIHKNVSVKVPKKKVKVYRKWLPKKGIPKRCIK